MGYIQASSPLRPRLGETFLDFAFFFGRRRWDDILESCGVSLQRVVELGGEYES